MSSDKLPSRRARQPVDDELKIQWALERYSAPMPDSRELARRYDRDEATVSRAISSAFTQGLVVVSRAQSWRKHARNRALESALQARFPTLLSVIVLEEGDSEPDPLHQRLGEALAYEIHAGGLPIWHRARIAIGSGRTLYHLAKRLASEPERLKSQGVEIISLCGDSYPYHDTPQNVCLDADHNVNQFGQAFGNSAKLVMTSRPIFMRNGEVRENAAERDWHEEYFSRRWEAHPPAVGISGVGIFDADHQLALLCDPTRRDSFPPVPLDEELCSTISEMHQRCEDLRAIVGDEHYTPVAELAMHLFGVPHRAHESVGASRLWEDICRAIGRIGPQLFAPRLKHLQRIGSLVLVGGTEYKADAIRYLLQIASGETEHERLAVSSVCTDAACAKRMLGAAPK